MEKKRVEKGEQYWFANLYSGEGMLTINEERDFDEVNITMGNCFSTKAEAESMARKLRAVLNGADVIEMPSEEEMKEAKPTFSIDYDPYYAVLIRNGFSMCYYWLEDKIVK